MADVLRPYQQNAIFSVVEHWTRGVRRVLLVAPTGAGKTVLGSEFCHLELMRTAGAVLFVVHRIDLVHQTAEKFRARFGHTEVGIVAPGFDRSPHARIQVGTVQTFLARGIRPDASLVIFDEAHHYAATDWVELFNHYEHARLLGLTATPERSDGKPLGDLFDELVVAAKYSELLRDGFLVPCAVYQPPQQMGGDLALDPLLAYQKYGDEAQGFVFCQDVQAATLLAQRFNEASITARCIDHHTGKTERRQAIADFKAGLIRIITNVNTMTEGVDVPQARVVMLAKTYRHVGAFLQACGRGLRPDPWDFARRPLPPSRKPHMIVIDLVGATMQPEFGFPTDDREYSLDGEGIKNSGVQPVTTCPQCLRAYPSRPGGCPECGYVAPVQEKLLPRIWDLELKAVFAGAETPVDAKSKEYTRLRKIGREKGWNLYFVRKEYKKLFGELPIITDATEEEQRAEWEKLKAIQRSNGYKPGFVFMRFKEMFGRGPGKWAA